MSQFTVFKIGFFNDPIIQQLTPVQRGHLAALMTDPAVDEAGFMQLTPQTFALLTGSSYRTCKTALAKYNELGLITWFKEMGLIHLRVKLEQHVQNLDKHLKDTYKKRVRETLQKRLMLIENFYTQTAKTTANIVSVFVEKVQGLYAQLLINVTELLTKSNKKLTNVNGLSISQRVSEPLDSRYIDIDTPPTPQEDTDQFESPQAEPMLMGGGVQNNFSGSGSQTPTPTPPEPPKKRGGDFESLGSAIKNSFGNLFNMPEPKPPCPKSQKEEFKNVAGSVQDTLKAPEQIKGALEALCGPAPVEVNYDFEREQSEGGKPVPYDAVERPKGRDAVRQEIMNRIMNGRGAKMRQDPEFKKKWVDDKHAELEALESRMAQEQQDLRLSPYKPYIDMEPGDALKALHSKYIQTSIESEDERKKMRGLWRYYKGCNEAGKMQVIDAFRDCESLKTGKAGTVGFVVRKLEKWGCEV